MHPRVGSSAGESLLWAGWVVGRRGLAPLGEGAVALSRIGVHSAAAPAPSRASRSWTGAWPLAVFLRCASGVARWVGVYVGAPGRCSGELVLWPCGCMCFSRHSLSGPAVAAPLLHVEWFVAWPLAVVICRHVPGFALRAVACSGVHCEAV